jgi:hypothetical protein
MFLSKQNSDFNELESAELLDNAVKNAAHRRDLTLDQYDDVSELHSEEASLVMGGFCDHEMFMTCGMVCDLF